MPLKEPDKEWIRKEIAAQFKQLVPEVARPSQAEGWKRVPIFLKEWGLMAVPIGMLAIIATLGVAVVTLGVALTANYRSTEHRLTLIEAKLLNQTASQAPAAALKELSSLDPKKLAANLPALRIVSEQPLSKVSPDTAQLHSVITNLVKVNQNTPDYWPTVLKFIAFASAHYAPNAPPPGSPINAHLGHNVDLGEEGNENGLLRIPPHSVIEINGDTLTNETFIDSRIVFRGAPAVLKNVKFINCAFEFPSADHPTPFLEAAGRQLLATGIQSATIAGL